MRVISDVQHTVNDMSPRVRALEDWKTGIDAVNASKRPIFSTDGVDWKAAIAILAAVAAAVYAAIKQVR